MRDVPSAIRNCAAELSRSLGPRHSANPIGAGPCRARRTEGPLRAMPIRLDSRKHHAGALARPSVVTWPSRPCLRCDLTNTLKTRAFLDSPDPARAGRPVTTEGRDRASRRLFRSDVQVHGGADKRLERILIYLITLMKIDGAPGVAFKAGVEQF